MQISIGRPLKSCMLDHFQVIWHRSIIIIIIIIIKKVKIIVTLSIKNTAGALYKSQIKGENLNHDLEKIVEGHSKRYHSKAWVRFPIRLP